jgi:hypothetical protein
MNMNVVFFYKSNWQNEGLRLARRNKFICAMMVSMQELGIEGPYMRFPGLKQSFPMYLQNVPHVAAPGMGTGGHPDNPQGFDPNQQQGGPMDEPFVAPLSEQEDHLGPMPDSARSMRSGSILRGAMRRPRGESLSAMNKRVDFSLGMSGHTAANYSGDVYEDRERGQVPISVTAASQSRDRAAAASLERERRSLEKRRSNERSSADFARTTSREFQPNNLMRRATDSVTGSQPRGGSVHRNRFFGRGKADTGDEAALMETGMADIPEVPSAQVSHQPSTERLDPRTGMVSPAAWRMTSNESNLHPGQPPRIPEDVVSQASGGLDGGAPEGHRFVGRSQTEDFEMRRLI